MSSNTIYIIGREFGKAFLPLKQAISSREEFSGFVGKLGWNINVVPISIQNLGNKIIELEQLLEQLITDEPSKEEIQQLLGKIQELVDAIKNLKNETFDPLLTAEQFGTKFPIQLISFLLVDYLSSNQPRILFLLKTLGILKVNYMKAEGNRPSYIKRSLDFTDLPQLLDDPYQLFENAFGWRTDNFNFQQVISILLEFTHSIKVPSYLQRLDDKVASAIDEQTDQQGDILKWAMNIPFFSQGSPTGEISSGLLIYGLPKTTAVKPGMAILPYLKGALHKDFEIRQNLFFTIETGLNLEGGIALTIRPEEIKFITGFKDPTVSELHGEINLKLANRTTTGDPIILVGSADGSNVQYKNLSINGGMMIEAGKEPDIFIEAEINQGKLIVKPGNGDSFLQKILPRDGFTVDFNLTTGLSSLRGFYFSGSSGLEILIPANVSLGPLSIEGLTVALKSKDGNIPLEVGANIRVTLGPVIALVRNVGLSANFSFPSDHSGNLGPLQVNIGFKPPSGVGLTIDAGGIKGGGILDFNPDKEEYFGALELEFKDLFTLKAFGILNTRMPDGTKNFSLLIIITAEFQPIQLGFGFTLNGVGGLLGVNRTTKVEVLKEGIKTNTLKSILFPEDVVANINRIVSDIKQVFPPQADHFLICPMGKIGWGSPTIISLELGILIEIPSSRLIILGVLKALLPEEENPLLKLQVNFLGIIDFENKLISFDASLFDSKILTFTLTGDMALRLGFGDKPMFILSVGGFHPAFKEVPDDLKNMRRITISLYDGADARIIIQTYFAVTSNTAQFGAKAELYAQKGSWNIYGFVSYDVLFQFSPFKFIADFGAGVALRRHSTVIMSIHVSGQLSGPKPWDARGEASVSFFFFSVSVPFHATWGDSNSDAEKQKEDILELLRVAINDDRNWISEIPANNKLHVSIRSIPEGSMTVHPFGILTFSERLVPLEIEIKKFGNKLPKDASTFTIKLYNDKLSTEDAKEQFAPANFFDMTDAQKLDRPSFEQMKSGFKVIRSTQLKAPPHIAKKPVDYEFSYLGKKKIVKPKKYKYPGTFFKANTKTAAASQSPISHQSNRVSINAPEKVAIREEQYVIANISDMKLHNDDLVANSYTEALQKYNNLILEKPELKDKLQVLAEYELN